MGSTNERYSADQLRVCDVNGVPICLVVAQTLSEDGQRKGVAELLFSGRKRARQIAAGLNLLVEKRTESKTALEWAREVLKKKEEELRNTRDKVAYRGVPIEDFTKEELVTICYIFNGMLD